MRRRLTIAFIALLVAAVGLSGLAAYQVFRGAYMDSQQQEQESSLHYLEGHLFKANGSLDQSFLVDYARGTNHRVTVIDQRGLVIFDSLGDAAASENHGGRPEVLEALKGISVSVIRESQTAGMQMMYTALPISHDGETLVLRLAVPMAVVDQVFRGIMGNIFLIAGVSILLAIVLFALFLGNETRPLNQAVAFADRIAGGDYTTRMTILRDDQIGELVDALNRMGEQLAASFAEMERTNTELDSILSGIGHPLFALDGEEKILFMNQAAYALTKTSPEQRVKGESLTALTTAGLGWELLAQTRELTEFRVSEFSNDERIYQLSASPIKDRGNGSIRGKIILLEDVTAVRRAENIRRDFVANVSHELKTPITTIRGFVETIREHEVKDPETLDRFYGIIQSESDRLVRLVDDILDLSHLENKASKGDGEVTRVYVSHVFAAMGEIFAARAVEKEIDLSFETNKEVQITFNPGDFDRLVINLVDNALKYCRAGERVEVRAWQDEAGFHLSVADSGPGIRPGDRERVFERFYRVDTSRSQSQEGTGLGLAIVKHIVQNNGGQVSVLETPGGGATFLVELPRPAN